jgi:hypothetical protein
MSGRRLSCIGLLEFSRGVRHNRRWLGEMTRMAPLGWDEMNDTVM